jgi:hypothetical protein
MVFNATFNNISVILRSDNLYDEEIGVHGGTRGTPASHCQTLRHKNGQFRETCNIGHKTQNRKK